MELPPCPYRHVLTGVDGFYCRHTGVAARDHLVNANVCLVCNGPDTPCPHPRPLPIENLIRARSRPTWTYYTTEQLMSDTKCLISQLPTNLCGVAGVPRSGMLPAALLTAMRHLPLYEVSENRGLQRIGQGMRLSGTQNNEGPLLIVDDSLNSGQSLTAVQRVMANTVPHVEPLYAAIYPVPSGVKRLDYSVRPTPAPRVFEWNFCNCELTRQFGFDLDGVICEDWTGDEHDAVKYANFLQHAKPLYAPQRSPVPLIVTARLEKHRQATRQWLTRHGVKVKQLIMGPWRSVAERRRTYDAGEFKGRAYRESACQLYLESDERQAKAIFEAARKPVLCVTTHRIFQ